MNRPLLSEYARMLAGWEWDIALLQEAPPGWLRPLARAAQASGASVLTSRNQGHFLRALLARLNPDLLASHEGGSNQILVRAPWRFADVRRHTLTRRPERRRLIWARLEHPDAGALCASTLHATAHVPAHAEKDVREAALTALSWSGDLPLVFGGDFNLRPRETSLYEWLEREFGFTRPTTPNAIDHVLARGMGLAEPPRRLPVESRELAQPGGRALRLSDHAPVVATFVR